ncbi:cation transporter [Candidatus Peregrinibacteria bacterium]|jgi:cation diffusion facilitator family transporter|nr:cation transporter [Candidatus Peregrinibacteria bacterium]MBT4055618.1 cation transporter [Candidatus Peregrinibacteria bacterium]
MSGSRNLIYGERVAKKSLLSLIALTILKGVAALSTGMVVLLADTLSSVTDIISLFASYVGLKLSRKSANKKFEYGYYKVETFASLLVSLLIIYFGYEVFGEAVESLATIPTGKFHSLGFMTTAVSIVFSIRLARSLADAARKTNSMSLMNNAVDKKLDIIASFAVLASILSNLYQIQYVESVISMIMSVMILKVGVESTKESLFFLLDYWDNPKLLRKIRKIILKETDVVLGIKKIRMRRAGTFIFGEAFIEINPFADSVDLREELDLMNKKIMELNPYIKDFTLYSHITRAKRIRIGVPISEGYGLKAKVAKSLKTTKAYEFVDIKGNKIVKKYRKGLKTGGKDIEQLIEFLKKEKVQIIIDNGINSLVYYNLRRFHHIQVYPNFSNVKNVEDAVKLMMIDI